MSISLMKTSLYSCLWPTRRPAFTARGRLQAARGGVVLDPFEEHIVKLQGEMVTRMEKLDGSEQKFCEDEWKREVGSGFGITRVLENGKTFEKAAVNISVIRGVLTSNRAQAMSARRGAIDPAGGQEYSAAALSLVFHPAHPYIPTLRADIRQFIVENAKWYGGGADLTPAYLFPVDAIEFHHFWKSLCDKYSTSLYPIMKRDCDEYFYLPARQEHRGIGGIFFDDLAPGVHSKAEFDVEDFVHEMGEGFLPSWSPIVIRRRNSTFSESERAWQLHRRGRYLEFNLLYDRGIKFGLEGGRMESIMVSAPPLASWNYSQPQPKANSPESELIRVLKSPVDWSKA